MTENLAASMKHKLRHTASGRSVPQINGGANAPTSRTPLLHNPSRLVQNSNGDPLWEDSRPWVQWPANVLHLAYKTLESNIYVNVFLVFVPLGIVAGAMKWNPTAVFILNFLAIIPLASLLSFATEQLSTKLGQTLGGLLNATFGNAVELIVCYPPFPRWTMLMAATGQYCRIDE